MLLGLYSAMTDTAKPLTNGYKPHRDPEAAHMNGGLNGSAMTNGHVRHPADVTDREARQLRDAEEFELEGLMSDDDDGGHALKGGH